MRLRRFACIALGVVAATASCAGGPPVFVHTGRVGERSERELGAKAITWGRITAPDQSGHKPTGVFLIESQPAWDQFFADSPRHVRSDDVHFGDVTVLAAYASDPTALRIEAKDVLDTGNALHVYLTETFPGPNCPPHTGDAAYELITLPKGEKPIHVHFDADREEACDAKPPNALLACRVTTGQGWAQRISASIGDTIECAAQTKKRTDAIVDQSWVFVQTPKGSTSKLSFDARHVHARFPVDSVGRYIVQIEALDDSGRRGVIDAVIDAAPPTGETYVEQIWTKVPPHGNAEPVLPNVEVHALDLGANKRDCAAEMEGVHATCDVQRQGPTTWIRFHGNPDARYSLFVRYLDARPANGPVLCIRSVARRTTVGQVCDEAARKAGDVWETGVLNQKSGALEQK